jgi:hypothetical protein
MRAPGGRRVAISGDAPPAELVDLAERLWPLTDVTAAAGAPFGFTAGGDCDTEIADDELDPGDVDPPGPAPRPLPDPQA